MIFQNDQQHTKRQNVLLSGLRGSNLNIGLLDMFHESSLRKNIVSMLSETKAHHINDSPFQCSIS